MDWNSRNEKQNNEYDQRFIRALVLLCKNIENVPMDSIETHIMGFIQSFIAVRAGDNEARAQFMKNAMKNAMEEE